MDQKRYVVVTIVDTETALNSQPDQPDHVAS